MVWNSFRHNQFPQIQCSFLLMPLEFMALAQCKACIGFHVNGSVPIYLNLSPLKDTLLLWQLYLPGVCHGRTSKLFSVAQVWQFASCRDKDVMRLVRALFLFAAVPYIILIFGYFIYRVTIIIYLILFLVCRFRNSVSSIQMPIIQQLQFRTKCGTFSTGFIILSRFCFGVFNPGYLHFCLKWLPSILSSNPGISFSVNRNRVKVLCRISCSSSSLSNNQGVFSRLAIP